MKTRITEIFDIRHPVIQEACPEFLFLSWEMMQYGVGRIRKAYVDGDLEWGSLAFSQACGLIHEIPSCKELIESMVAEAEQTLESLNGKIGKNGTGNGARVDPETDA